MDKQQKPTSSSVHQRRSAANAQEGKNAQKAFSSVSPVQKKESDEVSSLKADPAQLNELEEDKVV